MILHCYSQIEMKLLTVTIVFWLGTDVAEDKRTSRSEDKYLHHEIIQSF